MKKIPLYILVSYLLLAVACGSATKKTQTTVTETAGETSEKKQIEAYLAANKLKKKAKTTEDGLYYVIEEAGNGNSPTVSDRVKVHYRGTLLNGKQFDSSYDRGQAAEFPLAGVIEGWQKGIPLFKTGGKGKLIIPSALAYGEKAMGNDIPANSILVFDIELLEVIKITTPAEQAKIDQEKIAAYIQEKGLQNVQKTESGLHYMIEKEGEGEHPTLESHVKVHYEGTLLDGTKFDSSYDRSQPAHFPLNRVIPGWQEGIPFLKTGGKGTLIIPSGLAYGKKEAGKKIPANSVLIFKVELLEVHAHH
ncbi:MAG: FKBP-type peptidyl-prolyl cis-trans isomerase [Chitinophagales bacterium]